MFLDEFSSLLERLVTTAAPLIITGDFNFHLDNATDRAAARFQDLLLVFNLEQHVQGSTHRNGHTLDLVITRCNENPVQNVRVSDPAISDHCAVHWLTPHLNKPSIEKKKISFRKLGSVDKKQFLKDIRDSALFKQYEFKDVSELHNCYEDTLRSLLDHHAPLLTRTVTLRPAAPWYNNDITREKVKRRKLERLWCKTQLTVHREMYVQQCVNVNKLIYDSKMLFYSDIIENNSNNQRILFSSIQRMLNLKSSKKLPSHDSAKDLAESFAEFFSNKVEVIRQSFTSAPTSPQQDDVACYSTNLSEFLPTSASELDSILKGMLGKSCLLDPLPGTLMKDCFNDLLPVLVKLINLSFETATVPAPSKEAVLNPSLKKDSLDHEERNNFRPISNLRFTSKATEKVAAVRLTQHLVDNDLHELFQSAYREGHSTETALTRIHNDILRAIDDNGCVILVLLDLSAAFDTVDHCILLERIQHRFGITGKALFWLKSYLSNRTQFTKVSDELSSSRKLLCGVPQGSVLGPILYTMYTAPLADIIRQHDLKFHFYADDTQIYISFNPHVTGELTLAKFRIEACVSNIMEWMSANRLLLNNDKTELLVLNARHRPRPTIDHLMVGHDIVKPKKHVKNIGVWFDDFLCMDKQINAICKSAFFHLQNISKIRKFISFSHCEILIHSLIASKLDYCNSLLSGLKAEQVRKLQYVQNSAARLLTGTRKYEHITPIFKSLHWLPVHERIDFKLLLLTFKALNNLAPPYLQELLPLYKPTRSLRSSNKGLLIVPRYKLKTYGYRSFSFQAPALWNSLPDEVRACTDLGAFKSKIKTFLFKRAFHV